MNDLISRQAAIDLVKDVCGAIMSGCDSYYDPETGDEVYKDILEVDAILKCNKEMRIALRNMPSVEPERKKGKWIEYTDCEGKSRRITCDQCGHEERNWCNPKFCPDCGSYNGGEQSEID